MKKVKDESEKRMKELIKKGKRKGRTVNGMRKYRPSVLPEFASAGFVTMKTEEACTAYRASHVQLEINNSLTNPAENICQHSEGECKSGACKPCYVETKHISVTTKHKTAEVV
jgi:hypothetical protein